MALSYRSAAIGSPAGAPAADIRALQEDLRKLGYLRQGIDGVAGAGTQQAIKALQYDLLHNTGNAGAPDGAAPVAVSSYNRGVTAVTGVADPPSVDSIEAMLLSDAFAKLPRSADPAAANRAVLAAVAATPATLAPTPYLLAIFQQESSGQHYAISDSYVVLGLDHNVQSDADVITSRGYGIGQYTLFHHPPRAAEITDFVLDPAGNLQKAQRLLADKFQHFVAGATPAQRADDRDREHPLLALRLCRYSVSDPRYMSDCKTCARAVDKVTIGPGTPVYAGAAQTYGDARDYASVDYLGVPNRASFLCDWPYAVRRYNGSGPDSFNYQARVLRNLLTVPTGD